MKLGRLLKDSLKSFWSNRLMTLASIGILVSCLAVVGGTFLITSNVEKYLGDFEDKNVINIYLNDENEDNALSNVQSSLLSLENVENVSFISKEEALERQKMELGEKASLLDGLERNPLPDTYKVTVNDMSKYEETVEEIKQLDHVDEVSDNGRLANQLSNIRNAVTFVSAIAILALLLISIFIISNTIKLAMYGRRLEIRIMKSIGATNSYIKFPFLIEGLIIGVLASLISYGLLYLMYRGIIDMIERSFPFTAVVPFDSMSSMILAAFLIMGVAIGVFSSLISIRKYLRKEGSEFSGI